MIVAVVVTYSACPELLKRCVTALAGTVDRIIVVDNGGSAVVPPVEDVELIRVANDGYGAAANVGLRRAAELGASACALLNDDVIVRPGWIEPLVAELTASAVGAVQPKLLFADRPVATINSLGVRVGPDGAGVDVGRGEPDRDAPTATIEAFTGGAVVFGTDFIEATGGFDERYFLYYEDVDLAARGRRLGWTYRCVPESVVEHVGSVTTAARPDRTRFLQERNRLWCAFAHADVATIVRALGLSFRRLRHEPRPVHARALAAGLVGAPPRLVRRLTGRLSERRSIAHGSTRTRS